jgi:hypothetical protein
MVTRSRITVSAASPDNAGSPEKEADVETAADKIASSDVEQGEKNAIPSIGSVEGPGMPTHRVDIESSGQADVGDIERGPD